MCVPCAELQKNHEKAGVKINLLKFFALNHLLDLLVSSLLALALAQRSMNNSRPNFQPAYRLRLSRISRSSKMSSDVTALVTTGAGALLFSRLICLTIKKMMKAKITKLTATVTKLP